ncbi:MAG: hypothetical protein VB078_06895 [Clostridiaceae bacterium]|nr:hypothetical protein [Clostridiaceae bacterium]
MLTLPNLPYSMQAESKTTIAFRGINFSDKVQDGDLADSLNLSSRRYPYLSTRPKREPVGDYTDPQSIFSWDGHFVVVESGVLYYDGEAMDNVLPGEKQFAVVNTKLIIWPDKTYIDMTNNEYGHLDESTTTEIASFSTNSITASLQPKIQQNLLCNTFGGGVQEWNPGIYTYGTDKTAISWDAENGWSLPAPAKSGFFSTNGAARRVDVGDIFIPKVTNNSYNFVYADFMSGKVPNTAQYNNEGYYGIFVKYGEDSYWGATTSMVYCYVDIYKTGVTNKLFSTCFSVGDVVDITGAGTNNAEKVQIKSFNDAANTITFTSSPFTTAAQATIAVTVKRHLPDIDYICESQNRLWGVSNTDRTIYASALGLPWQFLNYSTVSTSSYAVAVGSEGDFTGICAMGGNVLCWKEQTLHKVLGSYPAEYQVMSYGISGVQDGSWRSMQVINERLFYKGIHGVYVYSGGTPSLLSSAFGERRYSNAVAGSDDGHYYISMKDKDNRWHMFVYDISAGMWIREDGTAAEGFCNHKGNLYFLCGGSVYAEGADVGDEEINWSATFAPFYETLEGRKIYSQLIIRAELPKGSDLKAEYRCDGGGWITAGRKHGAFANTIVMPVRLKRCDSFQLRLSGSGPCTIMQILRRMRIRSEK